jgi:hypothetical protein
MPFGARRGIKHLKVRRIFAGYSYRTAPSRHFILLIYYVVVSVNVRAALYLNRSVMYRVAVDFNALANHSDDTIIG